MLTSLCQVAEFHRAFNHPIAETLTPATRELRKLRVALIAEELKELADALGVPLTCEVGPLDGCLSDDSVNLVEVADALGDIEYVTLGAQLVFGIPGAAVLAEVHRANMSKLGADGKPIYRDDHKVLKGPNYSPPAIQRVLTGHKNVNLYEQRCRNPQYAVTKYQLTHAMNVLGYDRRCALPDWQMASAIIATIEQLDNDQV